MGFKLGKENRDIKNSSNTPILRKDLDDGILGEANMDGSVYIDKSVKPGSEQWNKIEAHEGKHAEEIKEGRIAYGDDWVRADGVTYPRKDGRIKYNGKWHEEGSEIFPWEQRAMNAENYV